MKVKKDCKTPFSQKHQYFPFSSKLNLFEKPVDVSFVGSQEHNCQMHSCIYLIGKKMKKKSLDQTHACTCNLKTLGWVVSSKQVNYSVSIYIFFTTRKVVYTNLF